MESREKRDIVKQLQTDYPITLICDVLDYPRSQVYYQSQAIKDDDSSLGYLTPSEYEMQCSQQQGQNCDTNELSP